MLSKKAKLLKAIKYVFRTGIIKRAEGGVLPYSPSESIPDIDPSVWEELERWETPSKYKPKGTYLASPGVYHASSPVFGNIPGTGKAQHSQLLAIMNRRPMGVPYKELDNGQFGVNYSGGFTVNPKDIVTSYPVYNDRVGSTTARVPSDLNALKSLVNPSSNKYYTYTTMQSGESAAHKAADKLYGLFKSNRHGFGQYNPGILGPPNNCNTVTAHGANNLEGEVNFPHGFGNIGGVKEKDISNYMFSPRAYPISEPKIK